MGCCCASRLGVVCVGIFWTEIIFVDATITVIRDRGIDKFSFSAVIYQKMCVSIKLYKAYMHAPATSGIASKGFPSSVATKGLVDVVAVAAYVG